jgi:sugar fermentation stimulation protein A
MTVCDGEPTMAHVANSGRLAELLHPDNTVFLAPVPPGRRRKTRYDLALVEVGGVLVSADARLPNTLVHEAVDDGRLTQLAGYTHVRREVPWAESRLDLLLTGDEGSFYVETKSVTLVENGTALFPDSPTERGRRHLVSLLSAIKSGHRAAVVFVVQRPDAEAFAPNEEADPVFCHTLREVSHGGVEIYAYGCNVSLREVEIADELPVRLGP